MTPENRTVFCRMDASADNYWSRVRASNEVDPKTGKEINPKNGQVHETASKAAHQMSSKPHPAPIRDMTPKLRRPPSLQKISAPVPANAISRRVGTSLPTRYNVQYPPYYLVKQSRQVPPQLSTPLDIPKSRTPSCLMNTQDVIRMAMASEVAAMEKRHLQEVGMLKRHLEGVMRISRALTKEMCANARLFRFDP